jgi:hypothetical protein
MGEKIGRNDAHEWQLSADRAHSGHKGRHSGRSKADVAEGGL